jgi:transcriptional regulator with PAS, ATPase and Fis domain
MNYLFFDNYKDSLTKNRQEKSLTSSLFLYNNGLLQLVNAGFYYKRLWKMPEFLYPDNLKITKEGSIFHTCKQYTEFDEQKYIKTIIDIAKKYNTADINEESSLVSIARKLKKDKIPPDSFFFFFNTVKLPQKTFNYLPDVDTLLPTYNELLGKCHSIKKNSNNAYKQFASLYFFLNLPENGNLEKIEKHLKSINTDNFELLNFPLFIDFLDNDSKLLFNIIAKYIPLKIYILSTENSNINLQLDFEHIEIHNFTVSPFEKHKIIGNAIANSNNIFDFFKYFEKNATQINGSHTHSYNKSDILIEKELLSINLTSKHINSYKTNIVHKGIILKEIGNFYFKQEKHKPAKSFYLKAMEILATANEKTEFEKVQFNLAQIELNLCNTDFAYLFFSNEIKKAKNENNQKDLAIAYTSLGKVFLMQSLLKKATKYTKLAEQVSVENNINEILPNIYYQLANIAIESKNKIETDFYLKLLKEKDINNFFNKEAMFLKAESALLENSQNKAIDILKTLKTKTPHSAIDKLHLDIIKAIAENKSTDYKKILFLETNKITIPYVSSMLKIKLLSNCKNLAFVLNEKDIIKEINFVKHFNKTYCKLYESALLQKRVSKIDSYIFKQLNTMLQLGINRNIEGFTDILTSMGKYLGLGEIKLSSKRNKQNFANIIFDTSGKLSLSVEKGFDGKLFPLLIFLTDLSASFLNVTDLQKQSETEECLFLKAIIGNSTAITSLKKKLQQVANFDFPVLIEGDSGTGKEMAAKAIHYCSKNKDLPFIAVNCAALPENLIESQLFGHKKGAFTGAISDKKGIFEEAGKGTVFLDEIGELSLSVQAKLLRVLQEMEAVRVGENKPYKIKARFVFATNRNLKKEVENKKFREDLYYRIAGIVIKTPSLNERKEDIPDLANHILKPYGKTLAPDGETLLAKHSYKGNVRELQNILMAAMVASSDEKEINGSHLPENLRDNTTTGFSGQLKQATAKFQKNYILKILAETNFNNTKSAKKLGITRQRLIQLRKQFNI